MRVSRGDLPDDRRKRSMFSGNSFGRFFPWKMKYHEAYHMFPMVPGHRRSVLHERSRQAHAESWPFPRRHSRHEDVFLRRVLPATARPCGEEFHAQASEAQVARAVPASGRPVSCAGGGGKARVCSRAPALGRVLRRQIACVAAAAARACRRRFESLDGPGTRPGRPRSAPASDIGAPDPGAVPGHAG